MAKDILEKKVKKAVLKIEKKVTDINEKLNDLGMKLCHIIEYRRNYYLPERIDFYRP